MNCNQHLLPHDAARSGSCSSRSQGLAKGIRQTLANICCAYPSCMLYETMLQPIQTILYYGYHHNLACLLTPVLLCRIFLLFCVLEFLRRRRVPLIPPLDASSTRFIGFESMTRRNGFPTCVAVGLVDTGSKNQVLAILRVQAITHSWTWNVPSGSIGIECTPRCPTTARSLNTGPR